MRRKALVVGGSIGGLFAGLLLRRAGWDVTIYERSGADLGARGAGIVTHDDLHEMIAAATGSHTPIGVRVDGRVVLARDGTVICEATRPQVLASWDKVWRHLRNHADAFYRQGSTFVGLDRHMRGVTARFADGSAHDADLLVGADGIQSAVRKALFADVQPSYAGYVAWRGLIDEDDLEPTTRALLSDRFGSCLPPGEQMLGYPVDGPIRNGVTQRRYNYVWYRPAAPGDLARLLTGRDGRRHADAIPPDELDPAIVANMRADAERLLAPAFADVVRKTRRPLLQPIVDLETSAMTSGRVALVGDAAFVARPHVGMGVTKAGADAKALVDLLVRSSDIDAALARYDAERSAYGRRIVRRARALGRYMQAQILSDHDRAQAEAHRDPQAVMAETATMAGMEDW